MIHEKSCGAAVFRLQDGKRLYLIENMVQGHVSLCKGHVEGNETAHETAAREIREETGLSVEFIPGFRETIAYSPYEGCEKEVVFFLAKCHTDLVKAQLEEVTSIVFLPLAQALERLTYEDDRRILRKADAFLTALAGSE